MKKTIALFLGAILSFGQIVFAQDSGTSTVPVVSVAETGVVDAAQSDTSVSGATPQVVVVSAATTTVQDTLNVQGTADSEALQQTANPEDLATSTLPVIDATTSDQIVVEAPSEGVAEEAVQVDSTPQLDIISDDIATAPVDPVVQDNAILQPEAALPIEDLTPRPEYTFAMTGKRVATKRVVETPDGREHIQDVSTTVTPQIDNTTGTMHVAGACSDAYFVVLLFKNQEDYARDPQSYILNRAFPCENQSFSYDVADLPSSVQDGTYYLLIGQEGERGPWSPITGLTEVMINHTR